PTRLVPPPASPAAPTPRATADRPHADLAAVRLRRPVGTLRRLPAGAAHARPRTPQPDPGDAAPRDDPHRLPPRLLAVGRGDPRAAARVAPPRLAGDRDRKSVV